MSAERPCEVCGAADPQLRWTVDDQRVVRCRSCGLVYVAAKPSAESLISLYDSGYWEDPEATGYLGYEAAEARKRHHFSTLLDQIEALTPPGEMLEIGSAYGYFLDEARGRGWRVRGVEPSEHAAAQARERFGLDVTVGPAETVAAEPGTLDAVVLWDVIEHLREPRRTLESAYRSLRPGGVLALSTGDVESLSARLHGADWSLMTPPWHQFYFSRHTLRRLLADLGFGVVRVGGDGVVAVDATSRRPRVPAPLAALLTSGPVSRVARRFGAGMTMFVYARKLPAP